MGKARKGNLLLVVVMALIAMISSFFGVAVMPKNGSIQASAETVEYQDILAIENRSWGAASDEYYFGGYTMGVSTTDNAHWLNTADSVNGCWYHGNDALIAANNGVDILKYIYVNDTSARDAITENVNSSNQMVGTNGWLTNPAAAPVYVETTNGSGLLIKILKAYAGENFTLTFKAGFSLIKNDGNVLYVSDDVVYNCAGNVPTRVNKSTVTFQNESGATVATKRVANGTAIGELPAVPAKSGYGGFWAIGGSAINASTVINANQTVTPVYGVEYQDYLGIEDRSSWASGGHADIVTFGLMDFSITSGNQYFQSGVSGCWYRSNTGLITTNNNVDILQYVYIDGVSARDLLLENQTNGNVTANTGYWLSNAEAWPIAFETGTDCWIRIDKTKFGGDFTFTLKAGFSLSKSDGTLVYVSGDITYTYENGVLGGKTVDKNYTLSFEGSDVTKSLKPGTVIGELPAIADQNGAKGVWTIDGVEITADSTYDYSADKTATVVYTQDIADTIGLGDWGVPESESDIRYLWIRNNGAEIATAYTNSYWNDHPENKDENYGVDIMEYILIDGASVRSIINANAAGTTSYKAASTFPLSVGGCYAPICIETAGDGIRFKVMVDYKTSFTVTFLEGFALKSNGIKLYTSKEVSFVVGANAGEIVKVASYDLTFEGTSVTKTLKTGDAIGALPEVPAQDGYSGVWTIDGVEITAETVYNYGADKTAVVAYTKLPVDVTETLGLEDRTSWASGDHADIVTFGLMLGDAYFKSFALSEGVTGCWYKGNDAVIAENGGVDILEYIYVNGQSARAALNANTEGKSTADTSLWLSNAAAWPIAVETVTDVWIRLDQAYFGESFTITLKKGFSIIDSEGTVCVVNKDIEYIYANDVLTKVNTYTLSFEGIDDTITVKTNAAIGALPEVPAMAGKLAIGWEIDGVAITADTVWTYDADKTATPVYVSLYTLTFEGTDVTKELQNGQAIGALPEVPAKDGYSGVWTIDDVEITAETVFNYGANKTAVAKYTQMFRDVTDVLGLEDRTSWASGGHADIVTLGLMDSTTSNKYFQSNVSGCWYQGNADVIAANGNVDMLQYVYLNGVSARDLLVENQTNGNSTADTTTWLSNAAAWPIAFETGTDCWIRIDKTKFGGSFTITFKVGFSLLDSTGMACVINSDIEYVYANDVLTRVDAYTLSFEGIGDTLTVKTNMAIGELPEVPEVAGKIANGWAIDGVAITADTVWTYDTNKTATPVYISVYTLTFEGTDVTKTLQDGEVIGELPEVPAKAGYVGFWAINGQEIKEDSTINANVTATVVYALEYQDYLGLEDRSSWASGGHADIVTFGLMDFSITSGNQYFQSSVSDCWYQGNANVIAANGNVDMLQYVYINGVSARDLLVENQTNGNVTANTTTWLSNAAAWPIAFETGTDCWIRIDKTKFGGNFTFTFKAGFSLLRNDGERIYVSNDITYTYENGVLGSKVVDRPFVLTFDGTSETRTLEFGDLIGALPEVPAKDGCEGVWTIDGVEITAETVFDYSADKTAVVIYSKNITETIGFGDWGVPESESDIRYLWIRDNNAEIATAYPYSFWNDHADNADSNYGVDIMEYILIDGESVRSIINANAAGTTSYKAASTFPLSEGGCYAPICIETSGDGIRFKVMVEYKTSFKVTFKAGFTLVNADGVKLYTTEDVMFQVGATMGSIVKIQEYTLSFDAVGDTLTVVGGQPIGELPTVPEKDGCEGNWMIDGVVISSESVYNYSSDKTAVAVYSKNVTETIGLGDWGVPESESDIRYLWIRNDNAEIATAYPYEYWNDHADNADSNYGVDIMEYILIDGESVRSIINANAAGTTSYKAASTFPLSVGGCYAPIALSTLGDGIRFKVMVDYKTSFELTFKAGFTLVDANGVKLYTTEDVVYVVGTTMGDITKPGQEYTLSFEGLDETLTVVSGQPIAQLPDAPKKEGCEGYWTIDGLEITVDTVYNYGADKTAVAAYRKDISKYLALEDRTSWGACAQGGEYYFGVLDMSTISKDGSGNDVNYLSSTVAGCWYHGNDTLITANGGVDIMQYIYLNDKSARQLIEENVNGDNLVNGCGCWLSNAAASPVYVETTTNGGIMIKILQAFAGDYFQITFKSGFSIINHEGDIVYLTKDVTYKYIVTDSETIFMKGELTDEDLDMLNGQQITLMDGNEEYFAKKTCRLTLPAPAAKIVADGLSQAFVGWTTDPSNLSNLYPAGYKFQPDAAVTLYAVWLGFDMQDGAAVRLATNSSGIRFLTDIDAAGYKLGVEKGLITGVGTFLVPTDYLETGVDFVHSSFAEGYYLDKATKTWRENGEDMATWTYAAAFVNISEAQYSRRLSARGYLKVQFTTGEGYVYTPYTEELNARSIYQVALAAYNDETHPEYKTNATILNYINKVANLTWDASDYTFERTDVVGDYAITSIDVNDYTVTVKLDGNVSSAMVNGKRLSDGSSSNVRMGDFLFNVRDFEMIDGGFTFTLGAAENDYDKYSEETLYFKSSDADLDFFLNDFFKRHSGYVENGTNLKVNSVTAGVNSEEFFSHEWMSMSYYWYNSFDGYTDENGNLSDRIVGLRKFLSTVPVDDYGYVWTSNDRVRDAETDVSVGEQKMGWPFPNNDSVGTKHWEFNSGSESWSSNISASASGGLYGKSLSNQSSNITFTSNSFSSWTSAKIYTFYAPLLEFEVRIDDATNIEDIYVWYSTNDSTSFSEDKKLSVKDKAFLNYDLGNTSGAYNHVLYLPMYAESAWGESTSTYMKQLKIEIALKSGTTISGNVALNYVRPTLDTRMSNNNSILISSLRQDYDFTGDLDYLEENVTRARKAMNFLMQMYDSTRGLKKESYLVGHGGTKESLNWLGNATNKSIASTMSQGYWDIMYMPEYDFQSNVYFYKALRDMAYLENVLAENDITVDASAATVKTATRNRTTGTSAYSYDLNSVADTVVTNLRQTTEDSGHTGFWNATNGRFVAGYASGEGKWYDYGYVAWNLEAIYYGVATEAQATAIMNWLNSESSLYDYVFAPRSNTVSGTDMLNGEYAAMKGEWDFGDNCQYGGAILYTSFYDLMARIDTLGADDAFARLTAIQNWYKEIYDYYAANGTDPYDFYRYYYDNKGIQCQGMGTAGPLGLDREFLESLLPISSVAYGFFGIEASGDTLTVAPELPADLTNWKMENLAFNFVKYDLTIFDNAIQLNNVRGDVAGLKLTVVLNYTEGQSVYVNGMKVTNYTVENGKVYVTVDMGATIVEVK